MLTTARVCGLGSGPKNSLQSRGKAGGRAGWCWTTETISTVSTPRGLKSFSQAVLVGSIQIENWEAKYLHNNPNLSRKHFCFLCRALSPELSRLVLRLVCTPQHWGDTAAVVALLMRNHGKSTHPWVCSFFLSRPCKWLPSSFNYNGASGTNRNSSVCVYKV